MDFIERVFGVSPDNGSGAFELLLFSAPALGLGLLWMAKLARQRGRRL